MTRGDWKFATSLILLIFVVSYVLLEGIARKLMEEHSQGTQVTQLEDALLNKIWFTSDQHYGHPNSILKSNRPFDDITHMNEMLIARHNELVGDKDTVLMLGDFSLSLKWVDEIGHRLKGRKFLIPGNHDWCHSVHRNGESRQRNVIKRYNDAGITVLEQTVEMSICDVPVKLSHMPYWEEPKDTDTYLVRYKDVRPKVGEEYVLLCGHVHHYWRARRHRPSGKIMYNVGVDVQNHRPVSAEQVFADINRFEIKGIELAKEREEKAAAEQEIQD